MNKFPAFPEKITIGEKYDPAMKIDNKEDADMYFERCVEHTMSLGYNRYEAEDIEKKNLGYYAGYGSNETRKRVESLFMCAHPIFGSTKQ